LKSLAGICRSLSMMLDAGVDARKAFALAAKKTSDTRAQAGLAVVRNAVKTGDDISSAMRKQGDRFPELMVDLVEVGERTGAMPEVLGSLSRHYESTLRLQREFQSQMAWPVINFVASVFIVAFLILILGLIGDTDMLGWGLIGPAGALQFVITIFGTLFVAFIIYKIIRRGVAGRRMVDPLLLQIPVLGSCLRAFAIARFSWVFALTQKAGMSIEPSLESSLKATSNGAFTAQKPQIWQRISEGEDFTEAIAQTGLFPEDFIEMVEVAEQSGTVPEALDRLSPQFEEEARRKLNLLASSIAWVTWAFVAMLIIFVIFSIMMKYIGMLEEFGRTVSLPLLYVNGLI
jgi:type IV pilus assembly protein PilC